MLQTIKNNLSLNKIYLAYLDIIQVIHGLNDKEKILFAKILELYGQYRSKVNDVDLIWEMLASKKCNKILQKSIGKSNFTILRRNLIKKGVIDKYDSTEVIINKRFRVNLTKGCKINFELTIDDREEDENIDSESSTEE